MDYTKDRYKYFISLCTCESKKMWYGGGGTVHLRLRRFTDKCARKL